MRVKFLAAAVAGCLLAPTAAYADLNPFAMSSEAVREAQARAVGAVARQIAAARAAGATVSAADVMRTVTTTITEQLQGSEQREVAEAIQEVGPPIVGASAASDPLEHLATVGDKTEVPGMTACALVPALGSAKAALDPCAPKSTTTYFGQRSGKNCDTAGSGNKYERTKDQDNRWYWWNTHYLHIKGNQYVVCDGKASYARSAGLRRTST